MTAEEILKAIIEMDNSERIKLLNKLYDRYFDNRPPREQIIKEKEEIFGVLTMTRTGRRGEIWTVELNGKRRPVVIVSNDNVAAELDHLIATVTSKQVRNEFDVVIEYWEEAGLDKPSVVRCSKLNTLHYQELLFKIGKLYESDLERVLTTIRNYF